MINGMCQSSTALVLNTIKHVIIYLFCYYLNIEYGSSFELLKHPDKGYVITSIFINRLVGLNVVQTMKNRGINYNYKI